MKLSLFYFYVVFYDNSSITSLLDRKVKLSNWGGVTPPDPPEGNWIPSVSDRILKISNWSISYHFIMFKLHLLNDSFAQINPDA